MAIWADRQPGRYHWRPGDVPLSTGRVDDVLLMKVLLDDPAIRGALKADCRDLLARGGKK